jgi:plastocyanin
MKLLAHLMIVAAVATATAAAGREVALPPPSPIPAVLPQAPPKAEERSATIKGSVKFKGVIPKRRKITTDAEPKCSALHASDPLLADDVVMDAAGNLQWALITVKEGLGDRKFDPPKTPALIEQKGCRFEPHVFGVMAGQDVLIRNHDDLVHIIHVKPKDNREFGFSQAKVGEERTKVFTSKETIRVFCDVHPWMTAWAVVLDHPYYGVTGADGKYAIKNLPAGKYTLELWHEKFKPVTQEVEVKEKETKTVSFEITDKP